MQESLLQLHYLHPLGGKPVDYYNHGLVLFGEQAGLFDYDEHNILYGIYTYNTNYMFLFAETDLGKSAISRNHCSNYITCTRWEESLI